MYLSNSFCLFSSFELILNFTQIYLDINECERHHDCSINGECTNTIGSHTCVCNSGFLGDGKLCTGEKSLKYNSGKLFLTIHIKFHVPHSTKVILLSMTAEIHFQPERLKYPTLPQLKLEINKKP